MPWKNSWTADDEKISIDDFYRILAGIYLNHEKHRAISLPFWTGVLFGSIVSSISNALNLKRPFSDPSLYALHSISRNLDFSNGKIRDLFNRHKIKFISLDKGMMELENQKVDTGLT